MDPLVKGAVIGALGASSVAALLYLLSGSKQAVAKPKRKQSTSGKPQEKENFYALLGDIGGTNVRYVLKRMNPEDRKKNVTIKELTVDIRSKATFEDSIRDFLKVYIPTVKYIDGRCRRFHVAKGCSHWYCWSN